MPEPLLESPPSPPEGTLSSRVRLIRNLLPPLIVLVVVGFEFCISLLPRPEWQIWAHLLIYGLVGPAVTFFSAEWIAQGAHAREEAEQELLVTYAALSASHERFQAVQELMRNLTDAPDMAAVVDLAAAGAVRATGATHAKLDLPSGLSGVALGETLLAAPSADLHTLLVDVPGGGLLTLHFAGPPTPETVALAEALAAEVATGIEAARQRMLDLMTLYSVDQSIRAERNMRRLLARVTENMAERIGADARAAYLSDQDGVLRLEYAQIGEQKLEAGGLPAAAFIQRVGEVGTPLLAKEHEAQSLFPDSLEPLCSALGLPMRDEEGLLGVLVLADPQAGAFEDVHIPLLALMAAQATLGVRNARAYLYSEELAISDERARIAREIHDGVAQSLAFCAIKLDLVTRQMAKDPQKAEEEIRAASHLLREQIKEVRRSIFALRPIDLERYGLIETVRRYVEDFGEQNNIRATFTVMGDWHLAPGDEAIVFRILQESLNNVAKHAGANTVRVELSATEQLASLSVWDNGRGFDMREAEGRVSSSGGLGLLHMRERVESRGGQYEVVSRPDLGTRVMASLPQT